MSRKGNKFLNGRKVRISMLKSRKSLSRKKTNFSCVLFALTDKVVSCKERRRRRNGGTDNKCLCLIDNYHHLTVNPLQLICHLSILTHFSGACILHSRLQNCAKNSVHKILSSYMTCLFKQVCWHCRKN